MFDEILDIFPNRSSLEVWMKQDKLRFMYSKSAEYMDLPSFAESFHATVKMFRRLPTQEEFVQNYLAESGYKYDDFGIIARALRAYPSLVRELHVYFYLCDIFGSHNVHHDIELDLQHGIDFVIKYSGVTWLLHTFVDTPRSQQFRNKKKTRHDEENHVIQGNHIDLSANQHTGEHVGDFWVYSMEQVLDLRRRMDSHSSESHN